MTAQPSPDPLTEIEYDTLSRRVLADVEAEVDRLLQDDVIDIDASRSGGLLELRFPGHAVIVINTQPPLHELWLASPAGGHHFKCIGGRWLDTRSGDEFFAVLSARAGELAGRAIGFLGRSPDPMA